MNLVIDVGNSLIKLAVFDASGLQHKKICIKTEFIKTLVEVSEKYPGIQHCMVSSVGNFKEHQLLKLQKLYPVYELSYTSKLPFINNYSTPATLGVDRMALVSAAVLHYPQQNVLIVDAGSCITYDLLTAEGVYLGGAIAPGIEMRYKALHTFTARLPLLDASVPQKPVGDSTATSMHCGVMNGVVHEVDSFITGYKELYSDLTVILTGGDLHFLRDRLKNGIFANSNFLLEGLHYILEHNID